MTIGAVCLGRDRSAPETIITTSTDNSAQTDTTRTTSAELAQQSAGTVAPAASPNITTIIVNPASTSANDNSGGTEPQQPVIIQQPAPASAPPAPAPADQGQQSAAPAPASTVSPESVEAQDQRDQMREQESYQQPGTQIIPVPIGNGGPAPGTQQVPMRNPDLPGANNPPSNFYPPGPSQPGQLGPNVPNGGASTLRASGGTPPAITPFGGRR